MCVCLLINVMTYEDRMKEINARSIHWHANLYFLTIYFIGNNPYTVSKRFSVVIFVVFWLISIDFICTFDILLKYFSDNSFVKFVISNIILKNIFFNAPLYILCSLQWKKIYRGKEKPCNIMPRKHKKFRFNQYSAFKVGPEVTMEH